jgi:hypothetical protein
LELRERVIGTPAAFTMKEEEWVVEWFIMRSED